MLKIYDDGFVLKNAQGQDVAEVISVGENINHSIFNCHARNVKFFDSNTLAIDLAELNRCNSGSLSVDYIEVVSYFFECGL